MTKREYEIADAICISVFCLVLVIITIAVSSISDRDGRQKVSREIAGYEYIVVNGEEYPTADVTVEYSSRAHRDDVIKFRLSDGTVVSTTETGYSLKCPVD